MVRPLKFAARRTGIPMPTSQFLPCRLGQDAGPLCAYIFAMISHSYYDDIFLVDSKAKSRGSFLWRLTMILPERRVPIFLNSWELHLF